VFSTPVTSVAIVVGHGFAAEAVVVEVTELQRLELRPENVMWVMSPVPSSEFVTVPPTVDEVDVTVLMTFFSAFVTWRMTFPLLVAVIVPVYCFPWPLLQAVPAPAVEQIVAAADADEATNAVRAIAAIAARPMILRYFMLLLCL
jgi:hypothetical protein